MARSESYQELHLDFGFKRILMTGARTSKGLDIERDEGDKGYKGLFGLPGRKGKTGSFCDCGKYRKVVGQLDVNVARLKTSLKFVKNVIAGIRESEEKFYYIVKEERNYRDALTHCRIRGGTLAMPRDEATNLLLADYISQSGLFRVYIGINDLEKEGDFMYTDNTPLKSYSSWKDSAPSGSSGEEEDCVEMLSTGKWNDVECDLTIFFVCEFMKKKK
ncbi:collectin-10 [Ambystoma mexicanum]|uniref:collectin-10 n=1 Tax=Ambystoma mexicanum TaxID=8296 RepID=UPI0037E7501E